MTAPHLMTHQPSKPITNGAATSGSQRDRRFTDTYFDAHKSARFPKGRPWTGERELAATPDQNHLPGFISGDLQPGEYVCDNPTTGQTREERAASLASAWSAPWYPLAKYFRFHHQRKLITFDYVKGEQDEQTALNDYYRAAAKLAGANGWGEIRFGVTPTFQVTSLIGDPSPYLPIYRAARAGDPWLLGHIDEPNEALARVLGYDLLFRDTPNLVRMQATGEAKVPTAGIVTPEQVLTLTPEALEQMIAAGIARHEAAKRDADRAKMATVRAARKPVTAGAA